MKKKYVIFDFDGTLTAQQNTMTMWDLVWSSLDKTEVGRSLYSKFHSGLISREQWFAETEREFFGVVDRSLISSISKCISLRNDAVEMFECLLAQGTDLFILSGGIKTIIYDVLMSNCSFFKDISANDIVFDDSGRMKRLEMTPYDYGGKARYITELVQKTNSDYDCVFYVGNSINDLAAFGLPVRTICISPMFLSQVQISLCNYCCHSLKAVLDYILSQGLQV